jgi:hypothetical protein
MRVGFMGSLSETGIADRASALVEAARHGVAGELDDCTSSTSKATVSTITSVWKR